jgi:hypothetical protein
VDDGARGVAVTPGHLNPVHIRWDKTCSTLNSGNTARHWHSTTADARDGITLWRASLRSGVDQI